ncbi:MAG: hypothetical protein J5449_01970, partial [Oscillospiraceae bacterium]|nr:hypothetical protein [Oscillospiraceae bacterium]
MHTYLTDLQLFAVENAPAAAAETAAGVSAADAGQQTEAAETAASPEAENPSPARRSGEEIRAEYRAEFDAEVQGI